MAINIKFTAQEIEVINSLKRQGEATAALVQKNIELAQSYSRADAESKFWSRGLERQRKEMAFFKKDVSDVASTLIGMQSGALGGLGGAVGGLGGAAIGAGLDGLLAVGKEISATTERYNRLQMALDTATGSTIKGAEAFSFVTSLARQTGLRIDDLADSYKGFAAASRGTKLEGKETERIFTSIVKAGSTMMLSNEQVKGSLLAVSQMMSKGNVQAEELRGQLSERLPGAFNILAQEMGVSTAKLNDMLKAGEVLSEKALPLLANGLDKISKDSYARNLDTVTGAMNNLKNEVDLVVVSFGRESNINGFFAAILNGAASVVKSGNLGKIAEIMLSMIPGVGTAYMGYKALSENAKANEPFRKITSGEAILAGSTMSLTEQKRWLDEKYKRLKELEDLADPNKNRAANSQQLQDAKREYDALIANYSLKKKVYDGERIQRSIVSEDQKKKLAFIEEEKRGLGDITKEISRLSEIYKKLKDANPNFEKSELALNIASQIRQLNREKKDLQDISKLGKPEEPPKESGRTSFSKEYQDVVSDIEKAARDAEIARDKFIKATSFDPIKPIGSGINQPEKSPSVFDFKGNTAFGLPSSKAMSAKMDAWVSDYLASAKQAKAEIEKSGVLIGQALTVGFTDAGAAFAKGENPFKAFGEGIVGFFGDVLIKAGQEMLIQAGILLAGAFATGGALGVEFAKALAGGAALTAAGGAMKAVKFADGGIVSGPTYSMTGEYRGAKNNPEVIAPLSKLGNLFTPYFQRAVNMGRYNSPQLATQPIHTQTNVYFDNKVLLTQIDKAIVKRGRI